ncbi:hypothetical protein [Iodobacter ciconiae]|uniref:hypothetical protein n=1 Tax=Iodobacter ciconiae TaxID=2496266 RepID=UPI0013DEDA50|nr:hypothetical protein [Iodobacter ciconiae]
MDSTIFTINGAKGMRLNDKMGPINTGNHLNPIAIDSSVAPIQPLLQLSITHYVMQQIAREPAIFGGCIDQKGQQPYTSKMPGSALSKTKETK